jgi:hypothetical protein
MESDRDVPVEVRLGFSNQPQLEFNRHVRSDIATRNSDPIGSFEARVPIKNSMGTMSPVRFTWSSSS